MSDASTVEAVAAPAEVPATQSVPDDSASSAGTAASESLAGPAAAPAPISQAASSKQLGHASAAAGPVARPDLTDEILKAQVRPQLVAHHDLSNLCILTSLQLSCRAAHHYYEQNMQGVHRSNRSRCSE